MATVRYSGDAGDDLARLAAFLRDTHPEDAEATIGLIVEAIAILRDHPFIGRPAEGGFRLLLVSRGRSGYVALHEYLEPTDAVTIHRIWHQREVGLDEA